nr:hypothetical protein [Tanacetum cinerariifolium]
RFIWVFFLATKDETSHILKTFITGLENQLSLKMKVIRSDNGTEFENNDLNQFCGMKDSLLPIPFWVEVVNTACYVQNRVLVTKPHNKTLYELLHSKTPSTGFMRPFGCPVTIPNTLNSLGKFKGKVDEGFLVGYSVNSKAFRVFNSRTRIVQETLHVNFLENKPNVAGSGPTWLFDIDSLTRTINYQPVNAGNQTNPSAVLQILRTMMKMLPLMERSMILIVEDCSDNSSNEVNTAGSIVPTIGQNSLNSTNPFSAAELEDITYFDDENTVGVEVDFNNLETSIIISPIPTTRIHKDYPVSQIISDLSSTTQTRSITRVVKDQDLLFPIPFWAEAVNTACYVQNRVLVTKLHNNTPYELLHGRLPSIGFMRPFGCPVTILNTLDPLGKFQGKVDEGFLVGYSVCSSGPAWLFDIDSLTRTMNYHPVIAENQTNSNAGFTNSQNNNKDALVDGKEHDDDIQKSVDLNAEFKECTNNSSNGVNVASTLVSTAGHNFINNTNDFSAAGLSNAAMPNLEDLTHSNDANDVEEPKRIHQALKDPSWIEAMQEELLQFKRQKVWILVDLPYRKRAIGTKWVYRNKKDKRDIVIKNKARLVTQGHTQRKALIMKRVFLL